LDAGSEYEQWLHRDLLFAGWCLTEDPAELSVVAADWVGEILDRLIILVINNANHIGEKVRKEVTNMLLCCGETTIEQFVWKKLKIMEDRIDLFELLEFQNSLGQESEVIHILVDLVGYAKSDVLRANASAMLHRLGNANLAFFGNSLLINEKELDVQADASAMLHRFGETNPAVVSKLLSLLNDPDSTVRSSASEALVQLAKTSDLIRPEVVQWLEQHLNDDEIGGAIDCLWSIVVE
jgi:hypothetical protein